LTIKRKLLINKGDKGFEVYGVREGKEEGESWRWGDWEGRKLQNIGGGFSATW
jgi:hypothetical protein